MLYILFHYYNFTFLTFLQHPEHGHKQIKPTKQDFLKPFFLKYICKLRFLNYKFETYSNIVRKAV